jgi:hypothetical protein
MKSLSLTNSQKAVVMIAFPVLLSLGLSGCYKDPKFSTTPIISFKEIKKFSLIGDPNAVGGGKKDSVVISIHFQDGNGDLGLTQAELNTDPWKGKHNFEVNSLVKRGSQYVPMTDIQGKVVDDSGNFFPLNSSEKAGPIEGTLNFSINYSRLSDAKDTVRFEVRIWDKALNASNWIETDPVVVNSQN